MKKSILTCIIIIMCFLSGCNKNTNVQDDKISGNPFNLDELEKSGQNIEASYGYSITNMDKDKRIIKYNDGKINIDFSYHNVTNECEIGLFFFIDGIVQTYRTKDNKEFNYIIPTIIEPDKDNNVSIEIQPVVGRKNSQHTVFISSMFYPTYVANSENVSFGNYHNILPMCPWSLKCNDCKVENRISNHFSQEDMTADFKKSYITTNNDGTTTNELDQYLHFEYEQNNTAQNDVIQCKDGSAIFNIVLFGGEDYTYRLSAFVDNQLVNAFEGYPYLDVNVEKNKISKSDVKIDTSHLALAEYNSLEIFCVPIGPEEKSSDFMIEKSDVILLVK